MHDIREFRLRHMVHLSILASPGGIVHSRNASSKEAGMNLQLEVPVLELETGQLVTLDDACGTRIHAREGTVWITEEGEPRDFVVGPGEAFLITRPGRTLVQAMATAHVALSDEAFPCAANDAR
jgi:hypothetical protein